MVMDSALAARDTATLAPLLADAFVFVHAQDGTVDSRQVWLARAAVGRAATRQRAETAEFGVASSTYGDGSAVRTSRVRFRFPERDQEIWNQQTRIFVRQDGGWKLALVQGTRLHQGPIIRPEVYAPYVGEYVIGPGRSLLLESDAGGLLARWEDGSRTQLFYVGPTELAAGPDRLRFVLSPTGEAVEVALVIGTAERWRARRVR